MIESTIERQTWSGKTAQFEMEQQTMNNQDTEYQAIRRSVQNYSTCQLINLIRALNSCRWLNTPQQADKLTAAVEILKKRAQYN